MKFCRVVLIHSRPQNRTLWFDLVHHPERKSEGQGADGAWPLSISLRETAGFCPRSFIFLALPLVILLGCDNRHKPESPKPAAQVQPSAQDIEKQEVDTLLQSSKEKNPFRPDHASRYAGSNVQAANILKGIVWDSDRPYAIIGNRVVIEGDDIDNKKVIRIEKDSVTLISEGKEEVLKL